MACTGEARCDSDDGGTVVATGWLGVGGGDGTARSQCVGTQGAKPYWWTSNGKETQRAVTSAVAEYDWLWPPVVVKW